MIKSKSGKNVMESLVNVENKLGDNVVASKVVGVVHRTDVVEERCEMSNMKNGKACGTSGPVSELLKAGGKNPV